MATYPNEATSLFTTAGFTDMSDRRPDTNIDTDREFDVIVFESDAGYEKRRLRSRRPKRNFGLTYTNVTGLEKHAIEQFYNNRGGNYESFKFDLDHISDSGILNVRFDGPLSITHINSYGSNVLQKFYTVSFDLKETYT